jgi:hypothetical protein
MASIHREVLIDAHPDFAWDVLRDVGAIHVRLAPGFVTDVRMEEGARVLTFLERAAGKQESAGHRVTVP